MDARPECTQITLLLPWFVSESLEPAERRMVRTHLIHCANCRKELAQTRVARAVFAANTTIAAANICSFDAGRRRVANFRRTFLAAAAAVLVLSLTTAGLWIKQSVEPTRQVDQSQRTTLHTMTFEEPGDEALFVTTLEPEAQDANSGRQLLIRESFEPDGFDNTWKAQGFAVSTAKSSTNSVS